MKNLLVNDETGKVENILQDDLPADWQLEGFTVRLGVANIGDTWNGSQFIPPAPPALTRIYKANIWRACTDQEFAAIKAAMAAAPDRLQALFNDVAYLDTRDDLFPLVMAAAASAVGPARASVLLTPTE